ncbi:hypothetical protein GEMRC1_013972 [Eukaryota sp. GEM-RC1]
MFRILTSTAADNDEYLSLTDLHVTSPERGSSSLVEVSPASLVEVSSDDGPPPSKSDSRDSSETSLIERLVGENHELKLSMMELISEVRDDRKKPPSTVTKHPFPSPVTPKKKVKAGSIHTISTDGINTSKDTPPFPKTIGITCSLTRVMH